jgi:SAM-dependent methyltransferase
MENNSHIDFTNVYEDIDRSESYSKLEFPGTYYLAYRDIPSMISKYVKGKNALDFGCGTGRSTRFLKKYGYNTIGIDISSEMVGKAKELDPAGNYFVINDGDYDQLTKNYFDLILSVFTFDNIPDVNRRVKLLSGLSVILNEDGVIILLDSTPEVYMNEWASFSTKDYPGNKNVRSGDKVKIIMTDVEDRRPVEDIIWFEKDYIDLFDKCNLKLVDTKKPLAKIEEPYNWINETKIAPWVIYVLKNN